MADDLDAIHELIGNEPILKRGCLGLLVAVFIDALKALRDNDSPSDVSMALEFIDEGNSLFVSLSNELDIEPGHLRNMILDDINKRHYIKPKRERG